jgi:hypothetical protein
MVLPFVLFERGIDTETETDRNRDQDRVQVNGDRIRKLLRKNLPHVEGFIHLFTDTPVPFCKYGFQKQERLDGNRFIITHLFTFHQNDIDILTHFFYGGKRQKLDKNKTHRHNHEKREDHQKYSFDDILCHNHTSIYFKNYLSVKVRLPLPTGKGLFASKKSLGYPIENRAEPVNPSLPDKKN